MSYPKDLDEYTELELQDELKQRICLRHQGLCDYCRRGPDTPPCKFPERHTAAKKPAAGDHS